MPQIIKVRLNAGVLEVDQSGQSHIIDKPTPNTRDLVWVLTAQGNQGAEFEPIGGAMGGFTWISTPPEGMFGDPVRFPANRMRMEVLYTQQVAQEQCWVYMLRVRSGGKVYSTEVSTSSCPPTNFSARVLSDPVIINR